MIKIRECILIFQKSVSKFRHDTKNKIPIFNGHFLMKAGILFFVCSLIRNLIEVIPPHDLTLTRIRITEVRIRVFWKTHGYLPTNLDLLPPLKGRDNATKDGWGKDIKYDITGAYTVTLSSVGSDELSYQSGLNQSISVVFNVNEEMIQ